MKDKVNYGYIDYLKFFFCLCVVGIHAEIFYNFNNTIDYIVYHAIFRAAVPFFFVASGFFLNLKLCKIKDINEKKLVINKYIKRLMIPYLFWLFIGAFRVFYKLDGTLIIRILKLIRVALFNPWAALWYMFAIIVFLIFYKLLLTIFKDKLNINILLVIAIGLYIFALFCNNYYFLIENTFLNKIVCKYLDIFITPRNGIFTAPIFILSGFKIAESKDKIDNIKNINNLIILNIILFLILIFETLLIREKNFMDDRSLYLTFIMFVPFLFILFSKFKSKKDTKLFRNLSTSIYFMHCDTIFLLKFLFTNNYLIALLSIIIDILILKILYKLDNKYLNKLIK